MHIRSSPSDACPLTTEASLGQLKQDNTTATRSKPQSALADVLSPRTPSSAASHGTNRQTADAPVAGIAGDPIHLAAHNGDLHAIQSLIQATQSSGADVKAFLDACNQEGRPPLLIAARAGHHQVIELLARHGADLHASVQGVKDLAGVNAAYLAAQEGHLTVIDALVDALRSRGASDDDIKAFVRTRTERGYTPLLAVVSRGKDDAAPIIALLTKLGADVRESADGWANALHFAVVRGNPEAIKVLVDAAGDDRDFLEERDWRGKSPLLLAATRKRPDAIRMLLSLGANGAAALAEAAHTGDARAVDTLLGAIGEQGRKEIFANVPADLLDVLRRQPGVPVAISPTKTVVSLPKLVMQNGHTCKLAALANLDSLYASRRTMPNVPLRKNRSGYYASQVNEFHAGAPATSIREKAKQVGSSQGEVLQIDDLKAVTHEMGYAVRELASDDLHECRAAIVDAIGKGTPPLAFFVVAIKPGETRYGWPKAEGGESAEHAALVVGIDTNRDTVDLAEYGQVFAGIPLADLHRSMGSLSKTRRPETYYRTQLSRTDAARKSYMKYDLLDDSETGAVQQSTDGRSLRHSIVPTKAGFKNCLLLITPDESHQRWRDSPGGRSGKTVVA